MNISNTFCVEHIWLNFVVRKEIAMVYRKKILLALLEMFGGELSATDLQKLLFLVSEKQVERKYDFVPYKFGCFSFQAMADRNSLIKDGYLENSKNWKVNFQNGNFIDSLKEDDRRALGRVKTQFGIFTTSDLIRYIYTNYPYFAINSEIATRYLSHEEMEVVERYKPDGNEEQMFTIGYEGRTLEQYLNVLIRQNIKVLCDVRKNPLSRKYGFAKRTLQNACEAVNIKYIHLPELGIVSEKRKDLKSQSDYDSLFHDYEQAILPNETKALSFIQSLTKTYGRVALTCYEALPQQCHRTRVANAVHDLDDSIPIKHL